MIRNTKLKGTFKIFPPVTLSINSGPLEVEVTLLLDDMSILSVLDSDGAVIQTLDLGKIVDHHCERDCVDAEFEPVNNSPNVCMCPVDTLMSVGCECDGV